MKNTCATQRCSLPAPPLDCRACGARAPDADADADADADTHARKKRRANSTGDDSSCFSLGTTVGSGEPLCNDRDFDAEASTSGVLGASTPYFCFKSR